MAPSRGIVSFSRPCRPPRIHTPRSIRSFATNNFLQSGHSRWSKIKHDKAKVDAGKNKQRSIFAHEIATASKLFGPDVNSNPRLADLITKAKREGFAKASIEAAIARGQGRSTSGASLEPVTVEAIMPNNVATIVECETDSKLRTLSEVKLAIKQNGGTATPTSYLFTKTGRIIFEQKDGISLDEVLEPALEAGATDVSELDDGRVVVWTEPGETRAVGDAVSQALELHIVTSDISWVPNEDTKVEVSTEDAAKELASFLDELYTKESSVQAVAMNISRGKLSEAAWEELQDKLEA